MASLAEAIDALVSEDIDGFDDPALGEDVVVLSRDIERLQAERGRRLSRFARRRGHLAEGAASIVSWVRQRCRMSGGAAAEVVTTARHLEELPETARALREGGIGYQHASVIAHAARDLGDEEVRKAEPILVEAARNLDVRQLREVTLRLRSAVDPDGALRDANRQHEQRRLHVSQTIDGMFRLDGWLDPESGAVVTTALNALSRPRPQETRTAAQRRHDALVDVCRRQMQDRRLPLVGGQRPHLWVMASEATLRGEPGSPGADLRWAGPVVGELARRLACDAACTHVSVGGGEVEVGRTVRTVTPAMRRKLVARDRGCGFPGCDHPPEWTDAHHIQHWIDDGPTELNNLVLTCWFHHRLVHEGGWRVRWGAHGKLEAEPP